MVFESADEWPSTKDSSGFRRAGVVLSPEAGGVNTSLGRWDQYKLPYTLVRPFNLLGIGESPRSGDREILSGNVELAMIHVVPDLVQKVLKGQDPLHHPRFPATRFTALTTYDTSASRRRGGAAMEHGTLNEDFTCDAAKRHRPATG